MTHTDDNPRTRRRFLELVASVAGAAALVACSDEKKPAPSSAAGEERTATPAATSDPGLDRFLALSAALTGANALDPAAGQRYLAALQTPPAGGMALAQLEEAAGIDGGTAPSFADLTARGVLDQPGARVTAAAIAGYWYSGMVPSSGGGQTTVTYENALGWRALGFAAAPGHCAGQTGFWTTRPA